MTEVTRYPLQWPTGVPRTAWRRCSNFDRKRGFGQSRDALLHELRLLRANGVVLSTNLPLRQDGLPYANAGLTGGDRTPGVAVYFAHPKKGDLAMACDRWDRVECNAYALAKTIEAMRGIARWGSAEMQDAVFTGFQALPAPGETHDSGEPWIVDPWNYLGLDRDEPDDMTRSRWRDVVKFSHPDKLADGGVEWGRVQEAWRRVCLDRPSLAER